MKRFAKHLLVATIIIVSLPFLAQLLGIALGLSFTAIIICGYAIFLIGMPLFFWIMGEAGYRVFFKPYVRAWHINRIRNARALKEAIERNR
ncbi:MAG TPA: hypothetical protein VFT65_20605 [Candidatus Angelobacter sp.]|nr:hypothetical protein [Candidatus Angelobacter sp.]